MDQAPSLGKKDTADAPADAEFGQPSRYTFRESDYRAPVLAWAKERFGAENSRVG